MCENFYAAVEHSGDPPANYFLLLMDSWKAFDSLHQDYILKIVQHNGFPLWFVNLIKAFFFKVKVQPQFSGPTDVWIEIKRGVRQGCPLSPILFALCIDPLLRNINAKPGLRGLGYVDDIIAGAHQASDLGHAMAEMMAFSAASGVKVNSGKSGTIAAQDTKELEEWLALGACPWRDVQVWKRSI